MKRVYPLVGVGVNVHTCIFNQYLHASSDGPLLSTQKVEEEKKKQVSLLC